MSSLSIGLKLVFSPSSVEIDEEKSRTLKKLRIGVLFGLLGFILEGIYIFPRDEINVNDVAPNIEALINAAAGAVVGLLLFYMIYGFDALFMGLIGERGYKFKLQASYAMFLVMPLICIPVHELFGGELSVRGYSAFVFIFIITFLAWHGISLAINLLRDNIEHSLAWRTTIIRVAVLFALELTLGLLFIIFVPRLFGATGMEFLEEYF